MDNKPKIKDNLHSLISSKAGMPLIVLVLMLVATSVSAENFSYSENIQQQQMSLRIESQVYSSASKLSVNFSIFPQNDGRQSAIIEAFPSENFVSSNSNAILFKFTEQGDLAPGLNSNVKTIFLMNQLKEISLEEVRQQTNTSELEIYKQPSNYSDSKNPIITSKAEQLIKTNNSIEILFTLADYVKTSMNYNLDVQELKKASQILQEKQGVCVQYTVLFIALARASGFPARYISGVAYSNKADDFEEHAWAEVYLPGQGWIPFDVTFGQYGWLDSSHVALKKSRDAGEASVRYSYSNGYIQPNEILIETKVLDYKKEGMPSNISIYLEPYKEELGQESYLPLKVIIQNNNSYYLALPIRVSVAPQIYGKTEKILFLEPNSREETYFLVYFPYEQRCVKGCKTHIEVRDVFQDLARKELTFSDEDEKISLQQALDIINEPESKEIDFYCKLGNSTEENKTLICSINCQESENLKLCFKDQCLEQFFEKDKLAEVEFNIKTNESKACINLRDANITLNSCVDLEEEKEKNWFQKLIEWINFQLTGFVFFIQQL